MLQWEKLFFALFFCVSAWKFAKQTYLLACNWAVNSKTDERWTACRNSHIFEKKIIYYSYVVKSDLKQTPNTGAADGWDNFFLTIFDNFWPFFLLCVFRNNQGKYDKRTIFLKKVCPIYNFIASGSPAQQKWFDFPSNQQW